MPQSIFPLRISEHLELRLFTEEDAPQLFGLTDQNRNHLRKWLPWLDKTKTVEDTRAFIKSSLERYAKNNGFDAGIWHQGKLAGVICIHLINWEHKFTSIGYWLSEHGQGKGIVSQSCQALIDYIFNDLKLNRIEIHCATGNLKSRSIPERLGFQPDGILRQTEWLYDHFTDHVVYSMLASEWKNRTSK